MVASGLSLFFRGNKDLILSMPGLFQLHNIVGTPKPEGIDLKPSGLAGPALPIPRLRGDKKPGALQPDLRVRMHIIEGGGEHPRLHSRDSPNETDDARGAQGMSDLGFECGQHCTIGWLEECF
jgi:hypothetical protein